jgi:hypothetical protein
MKILLKLCCFMVGSSFSLYAQSPIKVDYLIDAGSGQYKISPLIFGINASSKNNLTNGENYAFTRIGGNRTTGYNWENNASNAGEDWHHFNDGYLCGMHEGINCEEPGSVYTTIINDAIGHGVVPLATIQMIDFVSADKKGIVAEDNPPHRWKKLQLKKNAPFSAIPDTTDETVYADEFVHFLTKKYGPGKIMYALDNEPDLWSATHPRIFPDKIGCKDLVSRSIELSKAIKDVDQSAKVFGFVSYGFAGFLTLQKAPDWDSVQNGYNWFVDYYLDKLKKAADADGRRLVDVLDLHWYPEAMGDNRIVKRDANTENDKKARLQSPRSLWDPGYTEKSWIADCCSAYLPLLPTVQKSIDTYYPGTKLAFTEFQFGGYDDITGAIALTDVFGIFGKHGVYAANHWGNPGSYGSLAYRIYRNYDGKNSCFGNHGVKAETTDHVNSSVYASLSEENGQLHIIVLNKHMESTIEGNFSLENTAGYNNVQGYYFDAQNTNIKPSGPVTLTNKTFKLELPALSAFHIILTKK